MNIIFCPNSFSVYPGIYARSNISIMDGKDLSLAAGTICAQYFNGLLEE
jgi:hypothetical protein